MEPRPIPPCCTLPPADAPIEHAGYAAYNAGGDPATAGLTYDRKPCPEWDGLTPNVRAKWKAARQEMARRIVGVVSHALALVEAGKGDEASAMLRSLTED